MYFIFNKLIIELIIWLVRKSLLNLKYHEYKVRISLLLQTISVKPVLQCKQPSQ